MELVKVDVQDGKGVIVVAVGDYMEATRLRMFLKVVSEPSCMTCVKSDGMTADDDRRFNQAWNIGGRDE